MANPTINKFKGLDNKSNPESLVRLTKRDSFLTEADNVDISSSLSVSRRSGFSLADAGDFHSLWSNKAGSISLAVKDGNLVKINPDLSLVDIMVIGGIPVSYADTGAGIYMSNGNVMARYNGVTAEVLAQAGTYEWPTRNAIDPDEEQEFYDAPPPGELLVWMFGRLWIVAEGGIYYSRPFQPDSFDLRNNYIDLPGVTMLAPVDDGFYVATGEEAFFHIGGNPKEPGGLRQVCNYGAVARTALETNSSFFGYEKLTGRVVVWESDRGKVLGANSGQVLEMTSKHVSQESADLGAMFMREVNGQTHLVSSLAQSGEGSNMRTTDIAVAEVRRNGVLI